MTEQYLSHDPESGLFYWTGGIETKDAPKRAGFRFWGGKQFWNGYPQKPWGTALPEPCWWSDDVVKASLLSKYADLSARKALASHTATVASSHAASAERDFPSPEGLNYLPYQVAGIIWATSRQSSLIADEMGLGKTIQALGAINAIDDIKSVLVLCPASLRLNWQREAEKWLVRHFKYKVLATTKCRPAEDDTFVIANYAKFAGRGAKSLIADLAEREWDLVIADEVHYIKNPDAARTKALLGYYNRKKKQQVPGLIDACKRRIFLTGTPVPNRPREMQGILGALDPEQFGNFFRFTKRYCAGHWDYVPQRGGGDRRVWNADGSSNLNELQARLRGTVMIRRLKEQVLKELPAKIRQIVPLEVSGRSLKKAIREQLKMYDKFQNEITSLKAQAKANKGRSAAKYQEAVDRLRNIQRVLFEQMSAQRAELAKAKAPYVIDHVNNMIDQGITKIIVFAHHREVIRMFREAWGSRMVEITGDTPNDARQVAVDRFQTDDDVEIFVGNIKAAGVGLTLTASSHVVFAELDWVPANMSQAEDRAHRIGQTNTVLVQHLVFDDSLDARMAKTLISKQAIADKALDTSTKIEMEFPEPPPKRERCSTPVEQLKAAPAKVEPRYPQFTPEQRATAFKVVQILSGVCDGAVSDDGVGFNGADTRYGNYLGSRHELTNKHTADVARFCRKYHRQLGPELTEALAELHKVSQEHAKAQKGS